MLIKKKETGAAEENWTLGLSLTKGVLYHWATAALKARKPIPSAQYKKKRFYSRKNLKIRRESFILLTMGVKSKEGQDRLAKALRENLAKRKALLRAKKEQNIPKDNLKNENTTKENKE